VPTPGPGARVEEGLRRRVREAEAEQPAIGTGMVPRFLPSGWLREKVRSATPCSEITAMIDTLIRERGPDPENRIRPPEPRYTTGG
jgi:hypothetical protein